MSADQQQSQELSNKIRKLIDPHDLSDGGYELLCEALEAEHNDLAKELLHHGVEVNVARWQFAKTPLHFAVNVGNMEMAEMLLKRGADVYALDELHQTPCGIAMDRGELEFIGMVYNHGVDFNTSGHDGSSLLHAAAKIGNEAAVALLLSFGVDIETRDSEGRTPLHIARELEVVETLVKLGADVDAQDQKGQTPLHLAAMEDNGPLIDRFIWYGADINIIDSEEKVPFDYALESYFLTAESNYGDLNAEYVQRFLFQIMRMQKVGRYVSEKNLDALNQALHEMISTDVGYLSSIAKEIEQEVDKMKSAMVNNSMVSLYDFLTKPSLALKIVRNESVAAGFEGSGYEHAFPQYADLLCLQFKMVIERKVLIKQGCEIFLFLGGFAHELPQCCREEIFKWLSNKELKIFINACKYRTLV